MKIFYTILSTFLLIFSTVTFSQTTSEVNRERKSSAKIITKEKLLSVNTIEDIIDDFPKKDFTVIHFNLSMAGKGTEYMEFDTAGNQMTLKMKDGIKKLHFGNQLYVFCKGKNKDKETYIKYFTFEFIIGDDH